MARKKSHRYNEVMTFSNVIKMFPDDNDSSENTVRFKNIISDFDNNTILELGCGKGEYTIGLGRIFSDRLVMGIDIKSDRIWKGAKAALEEELSNVFFARMRIENIADFFAENSVDEIWIPFPDPQTGKSENNIRKRLTSDRFLEIYRKIVKPGGMIHLKTDDYDFYNYSKDSVLSNGASLLNYTDDLYKCGYEETSCKYSASIQTTYEKKYIAGSKKIEYLNFTFF